MFDLAILFGCIVGFSLGLTGGGGGVFAVPLLVYGLAVAPRAAVGVSLVAVGGTALIGGLGRFVSRDVELRTGLLFAAAGMSGAPLGAYLSRLLPESVLLSLFAGLMLVVAWQMWAKASETQPILTQSDPRCEASAAACQRDAQGNLQLTSRCAWMLILVGLLTGVLAGMFGVGGGFVIVPALILFSGMEIHKAVGTSLLVIFLVSLSGVISYVLAGDELSLAVAVPFLLGGIVGIGLGSMLAKKLHGAVLQRVFALAIVLVASFMILRSIFF